MPRNLTARGASGNNPARLPALPDSQDIADPLVRARLELIREWLEVRLGSRGDFYERAVTHRELRDALAEAQANATVTPETARLLGIISQLQGQVAGLTRQVSLVQSLVTSIVSNSNTEIKNITNQIRDVAVEDVTRYACDMLPSVTDGCSALTPIEFDPGQPNFHALLFDPTVDESADFNAMLPFSWAGRMFRIYIYWGHGTGATTFGVTWEVTANSTSDNETVILDFVGGAVIVDSRTTVAGKLYITALSGAIPIASNYARDGDFVSIRIYRRPTHADDHLDIDAALLAVRFTLSDVPFPQEPDPSAGELYLRFEGDFTDSSVAARTVTEHGTPDRSTSHPGGGAEGFAGDGVSYFSVVDDGAFDIGGRKFQIRFHLFVATAATLNTDNVILGKWGTSDGSWFVNLYGPNGRLNFGQKSGTYFFNAITDAAIPRDTLLQVTIWRDTVNGQIYCALEGDFQTPGSAGGVIDSTTNDLAVGAVIGGGSALPAGVFVDEIQFKIDETDYTTGDFTPPTPPYI